ncbi:MAG: hypothetical protein IKV03_05495 [Alphaproteobacteria bacterium]|nr:hypothetical protein [Alphaproteobacteria bacterium]
MPSIIKLHAKDVQHLFNLGVAFAEAAHECYSLLAQIDDELAKQIPHNFTVLTNDGITEDEARFNPQTDFKGGIEFSSALKANNMSWNGIDFAHALRCIPEQIKNTHCVCGEVHNYLLEFFPRTDLKVSGSRAYINSGLILKTNVQSNDTIWEYAQKNPEFRMELLSKTYIATMYSHQEMWRHTQKDMDEVIFQYDKTILQEKILSLRNLPFIRLVENTRDFLFKTLITHHAPQIASDVNDAKKILVSNKENIFIYAKQFGYIHNVDAMIAYQDMRDALVHPEFCCMSKINLNFDILPIIKTFGDFLMHIRNHYVLIHDDKNTSQHINNLSLNSCKEHITSYNLIKMVAQIQQILNDYNIPLQKNGKPFVKSKKLKELAKMGVVSELYIKPFEKIIKIRNDLAHGRSTENSDISLNTAYITTSNILNHIIDNQQKYLERNL